MTAFTFPVATIIDFLNTVQEEKTPEVKIDLSSIEESLRRVAGDAVVNNIPSVLPTIVSMAPLPELAHAKFMNLSFVNVPVGWEIGIKLLHDKLTAAKNVEPSAHDAKMDKADIQDFLKPFLQSMVG